jgi:hypothetical protein
MRAFGFLLLALGGTPAAVAIAQPASRISVLADQGDRSGREPRPVSPLLLGDPLRTALPLGQVAAFGDLVRSERVFGNWALRCEGLLSKGSRACVIRQTFGAPPASITWEIALTRSLRPVAVFDGPILLAGGLSSYFRGREDRLPDPRCDATGCTIVAPLSGVLEAALSAGSPISFIYTAGVSRVVADATGAGFPEAAASLSGAPDPSLYGTIGCAGASRPWAKPDETENGTTPILPLSDAGSPDRK